MEKRFTIIIADDHTLLRYGLKKSIEASFKNAVIREAKSLQEVKLCMRDVEQPAIILLDVKMPGSEPRDVELFVENNKLSKILIYTAFDHHGIARRYLRLGADGFVNKEATVEEVHTAIQTVIDGEQYIDTNTMRKLIELVINNGSDDQDISNLSRREFYICIQLAKGISLSDIADELDLHRSTVSTYKKRAFEKLNISFESELILLLQKTIFDLKLNLEKE